MERVFFLEGGGGDDKTLKTSIILINQVYFKLCSFVINTIISKTMAVLTLTPTRTTTSWKCQCIPHLDYHIL